MKRIKLVIAVGMVMVAMLALNAGSAMANEIKDFEIDENEVEIELAGGGDLEFVDSGIFGFDFLELDDDDFDLDLDDDDDDDDDFSINEGNDQGVVRIVDFG